MTISLLPEHEAVLDEFSEQRPTNGHDDGPFDDGSPAVVGLADFGLDGRDPGADTATGTPPPPVIDWGRIPLTVDA